ncbi:MAG: GAF domain-containing protein, partial [Ardenticatenaceae bacterium]
MHNPPILVLVVESNPDDLLVLEESLREAGCVSIEQETAGTLADAIEKAAVGSYEAVLLDLSLPDSTGSDTFRRFHARAPNTPVIILTGCESEAVAIELLAEGAQDYLIKNQLTPGLLARSLNYSIFRARSERATTESASAVRRTAEESAIMAELGRIIGSSLAIEEVYELFAEQVKKIIAFDRIGIVLYNETQQSFTTPYVAGTEVPSRRRGEYDHLDGSITKAVATTRQPVILNPLDRDALAGQFPGACPDWDAGLRSFLSVPLISRNEVVAVLHLRSVAANAYTTRDVESAERIAFQIAGAIANAQLLAQVQRQARELEALAEIGR